jgi:threonine dehydratase
MQPPALHDIYAARPRVYAALKRTPLLKHALLDEALGLDLHVKHENHNPTCAFKIRGGLNLVAQLSAEDKRRGVISASTGNHGQSIAFASKLHGVRCRIVVPLGNNPEKNASMRAMGAEVLEHGRDFDEARERVEEMVREEGWRYVHSANEPHLLAGVGTYALEMFEDLPDVGVVLVPIGGGSGACGCCIVRSGLKARARVIGVQAARADAFARSWRGPERVLGDAADTFAEGMATRVTFDLTFNYLKRELDDIVTLDEEELRDGVAMALQLTHNLAEGAGGATLAAAKRLAVDLRGKRVVCVMSGGNIDAATLRRVLARHAGSSASFASVGDCMTGEPRGARQETVRTDQGH